jgi:hypothetical protein
MKSAVPDINYNAARCRYIYYFSHFCDKFKFYYEVPKARALLQVEIGHEQGFTTEDTEEHGGKQNGFEVFLRAPPCPQW